MKNILIIGAGKSTISLINYLLKNSQQNEWNITVSDLDLELIHKKINGHARAKAVHLDINDEISRVGLISKNDIIISMLPAHLHMSIAMDCIALGKHMVTASYVSEEMKVLDERAKKTGVILMNEVGVDPGIDHISAKKVLDDIEGMGGKMLIFESFTGGLLAPESELNNPWQYKFTWNPRNVVLAGAGGAVKFKQEGHYKYIPYHQLFRRTEYINIDHYGRFEGYANRDSLKYRSDYGLKNIPTIYRGTLRRPGFCKAWDVFVKLGMTDDSYKLEGTEDMTFRDFTNMFLSYNPYDSVELKLMHYLQIPSDNEIMDKLRWIGIFDKTPIGLSNVSPAQVLEHILKQKWSLDPDDKDMIVMYHKFGFELNGEKKMLESSMVNIGKDADNTAMAYTVGLPVAIATKLISLGEIKTPGVHIPIKKEVYEPMLRELASNDINFIEKEIEYRGY